MSFDGVRDGYDLQQLAAVRSLCEVPLIASGGAGSARHFAEAFNTTGVDGCLAASVFHSGELAIYALKEYLIAEGVVVRTERKPPRKHD
jgi:cyclase